MPQFQMMKGLNTLAKTRNTARKPCTRDVNSVRSPALAALHPLTVVVPCRLALVQPLALAHLSALDMLHRPMPSDRAARLPSPFPMMQVLPMRLLCQDLPVSFQMETQPSVRYARGPSDPKPMGSFDAAWHRSAILA